MSMLSGGPSASPTNSTAAGVKGGILIVGGYGHVGRRIAAHLLEAGAGPVRLAGRNPAKAASAAAQLGCKAVGLDLALPSGWPAALADIACVIVCVDQTDTAFAAAVLRRGLLYVDITADDAYLREVERLDGLACTHGGAAVLSIGLAPGLTNLLASACANGLHSLHEIRIGVLLGVGDAHGPAAIDWTLRNFRTADTRRIEAVPFGAAGRLHPAIPFDFADQHVLRRTLGVANTRTLLTFETPLISRAMFFLLSRVARWPLLRAPIQAAMPWLRLGSERAALSVTVRGLRNGEETQVTMTLEGRKEADITALVAARAVTHLLQAGARPGVHHIEQVMSLDTLAPALADAGVAVARQDPQAFPHPSPTTSQTNCSLAVTGSDRTKG